jgi:glycosyltransferase involved in cell wall biosynthesis
MPDMIKHQRTGYLAVPFDAQDLAQGISWTLLDEGRRQHMGEEARHKVLKDYTLKTQAGRYVELFSELVDGKPRAKQLETHVLPEEQLS